MNTRIFARECFRYLFLYWSTVLSMVLWGAALVAAVVWFPGPGDGITGAARDVRAGFLLSVQGMLAVGVLWGVSEVAFDLLHPATASFFLSKPIGRRAYAAVVFGSGYAVMAAALVVMAASGASVLAAGGGPLSVAHLEVLAGRMILASGAIAVALVLSVSLRVRGVAVMAGSAIMVFGSPKLLLPAAGEALPGAAWWTVVSGLAIAGTGIAWIVFTRRDLG